MSRNRITCLSISLLLALGAGCGDEGGESCSNGIQDPGEGGVDCGGECGLCAMGSNCTVDADCESGHCSLMHQCVECTAAATCPGTDGVCGGRTCLLGVCGTDYVADGDPATEQTDGDCQEVQCDGSGGTTNADDDTDISDDGDPCTQDVCTAGTPSHPFEPSGTACGTDLVCDGAGNCGGCLAADECPGTDTECRTRTCTAGECGFDDETAGTPTTTGQTDDDCREVQCDGSGGTTDAVDDTDLPDDGDPCTQDVCTDGTPSNPLAPAGTTCGTDLTCDDTGHCVGCTAATECPGTDDECGTRTCTAGVCGMDYTTAGTAIAAQTDGDCLVAQCDGAGTVEEVADDADLPDDSNECTDDVCTAGVPTNPALGAGTTCTDGVCDGAGACVECLAATDCGTDTECASWSCSAAHTCEQAFVAAGTATTTQTAGDCQETQCDGAGVAADAVDDTDLPDDSNDCTDDLCTAGVPSNPALAAGASCGTAGVCDGAGACIGCVTGSDCPGTDDECGTRTCTTGTCGMSYTAAGTPTATQTAGDCLENRCDGAGSIAAEAFDTDLPIDALECTDDVCTAGVATNPPVAAGTACGGGIAEPVCNPDACDGAGVCVDAAGAAAGTPCGDGILEPVCNPDVCDAAGACTNVATASDGTACDDVLFCNGADTCATGACSHAGDPCTTSICSEITDTCTANVWVNELHYDNDGTDADEGVEIAGPAGTDLTGWTVVLYNGSGGASYDTITLAGTLPDFGAGFGALWFPRAGIQNGAPDGLALVAADASVVQFLCYEGTFAAVGGPADGLTCDDIGVSQSGSDPVGETLQLSGTGHRYADFTWAAPAAGTTGAINGAQTFL